MGCDDWAHYPTWFSHVFSGMYASTYSSYLLGDFAVEDLFLRLRESISSDPEAGRKLYDGILRPGTKIEGAEMLEAYLGRPMTPETYLRSIGLIPKEEVVE